MLEGKGGHAQVMAQAFRKGIYVTEAQARSMKEKISSIQSQTRMMDCLDPSEESTWSKNLDSAASMFSSTLSMWEEDFQDLSTWCHSPLQNMNSAMEHVTNGSRCIVQGDELNTPEVGIQSEFNFTSDALIKEDTSCLSDEEGWDIPPTVEIPLESTCEEPINSVTSIQFESSISGERSIKPIQEIVNNPKCNVEDKYYYDESWGLALSHEEQVISSPSPEDRKPVDNKTQSEVNTLVNTIQFDNYCEMVIDYPVSMTLTETDLNPLGKNKNLESLLGVCSAPSSEAIQQQNPNLSLKNLLADSIYKINIDANDRIYISTTDNASVVEASNSNINTNKVINTAVSNMIIPTTSRIISPVKTSFLLNNQTKEKIGLEKTISPDVDDAMLTMNSNAYYSANIPVEVKDEVMVNLKQSEIAVFTNSAVKNCSDQSSETFMSATNFEESINIDEVMKKDCEEFAPKQSLKLNLASLIGTDDISTPVLEPIIKGDGPFDLLAYISDNNPVFPFDSPSMKLDKDLPKVISSGDVSINLSIEEEQKTIETGSIESEDELQKDRAEITTVDLTTMKTLIEPLVVKSVAGQWAVSHYEEKSDDEGDDQPEVQLKYKSSPRSKSTKSLSSGGRKSSKRKISEVAYEVPQSKKPRGRPAKQSFASTSREDVTYSIFRVRRQRKPSSSVSDEIWTPAKLSRRSSIESECDRYRELRDKNNEASRKSRQSRKTREYEMKETAAKLEKENQSLRIKAEEMERLVKTLREALLEAVVKNKEK